MNVKELMCICAGILLGSARPAASVKVNCSRAESDIVRRFLDEKVVPAYEKLGASIPDSCVWSRSRDQFGKQNLMIVKLGEENWQCGFCRKEFYSESYLWQHLDHKHADELHQGPHAVCLADLCPLFRCDVLNSLFTKRATTNWAQKLCNRDHMLALRSRSTAMIADCLDPDAAHYRVLREYLQSIITEFLSCEKYWQRAGQAGDRWLSISVYVSIALFVVGLVVYYIALFVRLNKLDSDLGGDSSSDEYPIRRQHRGKYHGVDLTYRGKRALS